MKIHPAALAAGMGALVIGSLSLATSSAPASAATQLESLGAQLANKGSDAGIAPCASCHGANGEGMAAGGFPRLAGQFEQYLAKQLVDYANGRRNHPVMTPIAKQLNDQQREAAAAYYASRTTPPTQPEAAAADVLQRGEVLVTRGDESIQVQACANCHGPGGTGEPPTYPYLAGQHASYTINALTEWQNGNRDNDPSQQMPHIARSLSKNDVAALAAYFAGQPPPVENR
jgi:cytochrome c553